MAEQVLVPTRPALSGSAHLRCPGLPSPFLFLYLLLKDKLMHIKIFLPVYLNRNLLESAAPNRKWLGVLRG